MKRYIESNKERFLQELYELIRIPSISAEEAHKPDMKRAANYLRDSLLQAGADRAEVFPTEGNPVVFGQRIVSPDKPTILVYGHYDVMPVTPLELWKSSPFEPEIRDGKIYARGADDDKGQSFMHIKAFEMMNKTDSLPCNVKFMIEGEEEIGSEHLGQFCKENREMLKADVILISDTTMIAEDTPSITSGLRGLAYMQVEVTGPDHDLHSGIFGGAVANPCNILCDMIASMKDADNKVTIPGFYDDVYQCNDDERKAMAQRPYNAEAYMSSIGVKALHGEAGYSTIERTGIRPTLDVNGMWGGHTGEGTKTVLPSKAYAKISMRLVPNQKPEVIAQRFEDYFNSIAPESVTVKVEYLHGGEAYMSPLETPEYKAAEMALEEVYGKKPIPVRSGGSIPIVATFEKELGVKSILIGFGLDTDSIHSPNENYPVSQFLKGIEVIPLYYKYYSVLK